MNRLAWEGALLFAFIPLVLVLYLRQPLGPRLSMALGLVVMFGHRFLAAPWMARHTVERCLWCGRAVSNERRESGSTDLASCSGSETPPSAPDVESGLGRILLCQPVQIVASGRSWTMAACGPRHRDRIGRFLTFVARARVWIALGIFGPLLVLVAGTLALAAGHPVIPPVWNAFQFRVIVALTVVGVSLLYLTVRRPQEPLTCPFPLHNLFLLGIGNTLWVFRVVGVWWLVGGVRALVRVSNLRNAW